MLSDNLQRLELIYSFIPSETMRLICRGNKGKAFTRDRSLPFYDVLLLTLLKKGITLSSELSTWFKSKKGDDFMATTNEAYLKQRRHLNPEAFKILNKTYLSHFYHANQKVLYNDYLVLAVDGTDLEIPNTSENRRHFGSANNQCSTNSLARASASAIYDLNNDFILDMTVEKYKTNEITMAKKNIEEALEILGNQKYLILFDRNYPSLEFFNYLEERNIKFIIRVNSNDYKKEFGEMKTSDEEIEISHFYARLQHIKKCYPEYYQKAIQTESTHLRGIKTTLSSGIEEKLLTNLNKNEFTMENIIYLYGQRWGIEEGFNTLKNKLKIERFTGYSSQFIYQDVYAQTIVYNMLHDMMQTAEIELQEKVKNKQEHDQKTYKNARQINENCALGLLKEQLIHILLCEDNLIRAFKYAKLISEMQKYTSVIRKGRAPKPRKWNNANKNSTNRKDSF